jgi:dTDP-4-amino-4,6-dideoxygalactose transaminase
VDLRGFEPLSEFLSFAPPSTASIEEQAAVQTLSSGWLATGPRCKSFEQVMARRLNVDDALALSSCTAALHLAMRVIGLGPGQAFITTPLTFASTAHAGVYLGARPILADVSPDTGNLDPDKVGEILERDCLRGKDGRPVHNQTGLTVSALVPVHYGGHPADLRGLWDLAVKYRLHMVEDAAHALGTLYNKLPVGCHQHAPAKAARAGLKNLCCFSFYATKNITTGGDGGLLTSSDPELLERARRLSAYGISDGRRIWGRYSPQGSWAYDVTELGYKYNLTDLQAAIGLAQMSKLDKFLKQRAQRAMIWSHALWDLDKLAEMPAVRDEAWHSWHLFPLRIIPEALTISRDQLIMALKALNIGTSVMFIPLHYHSYYRDLLGYEQGDFPVAEDFFEREISLPVSPGSSLKSIRQAAELLGRLLARHAA